MVINYNEINYLNLVQKVYTFGEDRPDRTGVGVRSLFGAQARYDLRNGFPLVTAKKTYFSSVVKELLWFLRGQTNINTLGCTIWDEWADDNGDLGPVYGAQWRNWGGSVDQISAVIDSLKADPESRRHIVTAWNPSVLDDMALPPCHVMFQFYASNPSPVTGVRYLDLQLYQRSADLLLGVPFNIASYSLLLMLIAREVEMEPRAFIHTLGDVHIYQNHLSAARELLIREPFAPPSVEIIGPSIFSLQSSHIHLKDYVSHPYIKLAVAV